MSKNSKSVDFGYLDDKKVKKGEKKVLEQTKDWAGSRKEEKNIAREEKASKAAKKHAASKNHNPDKISWKKQAGIIGMIVFMFGVGLFNFLSTVFGYLGATGVNFVDVTDTPTLKAVLFDGEPWLVYCVTDSTKDARLPPVLEDSTTSLKRNLGLKVAVIRCWDKMESGRTIAQRFKLKKSPPLTFVVANGDSPKLLDLIGISTTEELEKRIKPALKVAVARIDNLKKWPAQCTSRRTCVVVGHKNNAQKTTAMNLLTPLTEKHRATKFVTLDTSFWQLKLDEAVLKTRPGKEDENKGADVLCLARDSGEGGNATYSGTFLQAHTASEASSFVKACESRYGLAPVPSAPRIQARPSKPRKATVPTRRRRNPTPTPPPPRKADKGNVDRVGSRASMEEEEALFEAVEEEDEGQEGEEGGEEDESDEEEEEVEL